MDRVDGFRPPAVDATAVFVACADTSAHQLWRCQVIIGTCTLQADGTWWLVIAPVRAELSGIPDHSDIDACLGAIAEYDLGIADSTIEVIVDGRTIGCIVRRHGKVESIGVARPAPGM